jgi:DoxX-like family
MPSATTSNQQAVMEQPSANIRNASKGMQWTGRLLSGLAVLFMLWDAAGKFMMPPQVVEACARLGIPASQTKSIGALLLVSTIIYAIPRTAVLGAVLLTGYLGGAVAIQMRAGSPTFETVFPVIFGIIVWAGVYLRECGLRRVFPIFR